MFNNIEDDSNPKIKFNPFKESSKSINKLAINDSSRPRGSLLMLNSTERENLKLIKGNLKIVKSESLNNKFCGDAKSAKLTFDNVFNNAFNANPQIEATGAPINININNININNYNIGNFVRKSNTSGANTTAPKKIHNFQNYPYNSVHIGSVNNNNSESNPSFKNSSSVSQSNQKQVDVLPKLNNIQANSAMNKKIISSKISLKISPKHFNSKTERESIHHSDRSEKQTDAKTMEIVRGIESNVNVNKSSRKKLSGTIMGADDLNDSLINDLADFLNGPGEAKPKQISNEKENNIDDQGENELDKAVINEPDEPLTIKKKNSKKSPQNFREITEKQIKQSNDEMNVFDQISNLRQEEEEQGMPVNFEHMQQVNERRPQTSYGGISARQRSLQNSLRQMSSKVDSKDKKGEDLQNPFGMKNKLSQMKQFFG